MPSKFQTLTASGAFMAAAALTGATAIAGLWSDSPVDALSSSQATTELPSPAIMDYDELHGLPIYDAEADPIGTVAEVRVGPDGQVTGAIAEIGSFLGFGGRLIDLDLHQMGMRGVNSDAADPAVQLLVSNAELEQLPRFDG
ncbi:PRC-barrel domain-containing protein [Primorskyibacter sedentarius]|uniref:PRC-barrel domain-containing protein n=1 Tax=Primorskyibacter sedentarius TaxID=745311 RepID=UPI003EBFA896